MMMIMMVMMMIDDDDYGGGDSCIDRDDIYITIVIKITTWQSLLSAT